MIIQGRGDFLIQKGADFLATAIQILASVKPRVVLGIADGAGIRELVEFLVRHDLPWGKLHLFLLEEGLDPESYKNSLGLRLCKVFGQYLEPERLHLFPRYTGDMERGLALYRNEFILCGGSLDIVLVSCGEQGRICGLYPNHSVMEERTDGYVLVDDIPEPPYSRLTAGPGMISAANTGILLALGPSRAVPVANFFDTYLSEIECPAKLLSRLDRYYLLTDQNVALP